MKHILIIDDQTNEDFSIEPASSDNSLKFHTTSGVSNGFEIATRYAPDLIICNLQDDERGSVLLKKLIRSTETQTIPIIYVSSSTDDKDRRKIRNLGADDYFVRPLDIKELIRAVKCLLKKRTILKVKMMDICRESLEAENKLPKKDDHILITIGNKLQLIKYKNIVCITALKEYSKLRTFDGKKIVVRKSLKAWIELLPPKGFLRIHRSSIINVEAIEKIQKLKERTYVVYLRTLDKPLELSQRYSNVMRNTFPS